MSISVIENNGICYPTNVYYKYNLYLIKEYELFKYKISKLNLDVIVLQKNKKYCKNTILNLCVLLEENISLANDHIFSIMDWEEKLLYRYEKLIWFYDRYDEYGFMCFSTKIKTINTFLRQEKLERINEKM